MEKRVEVKMGRSIPYHLGSDVLVMLRKNAHKGMCVAAIIRTDELHKAVRA